MALFILNSISLLETEFCSCVEVEWYVKVSQIIGHCLWVVRINLHCSRNLSELGNCLLPIPDGNNDFARLLLHTFCIK